MVAMIVTGTVAIAIVVTGGWIALRAIVGEPSYDAFKRRADAAMKTVVPLPRTLVIARQWEECGQGRDPLCDSVELLVRDTNSHEPPVATLVDYLKRRGWEMQDPVGGAASGSLGSFRVEIRSLEDYVRRYPPPSFEIEDFLAGNSGEGIASVSVFP